MRDLGVVELLFTSDGQVALEHSRTLRPAKDVLLTVNFQNEKQGLGLKKLLELQVCVCVCVCVSVCYTCCECVHSEGAQRRLTHLKVSQADVSLMPRKTLYISYPFNY